MIIARPLVVGVEEVRSPWSSLGLIYAKRPLDVGLRHATGVHAPFGPRTLPCLTLGWCLWPPPKWAASWICPTRKQAPASARWTENPQCSAARQNAALEVLLQKRPSDWQDSDDCNEQHDRSAAREAFTEASAATASSASVDEPDSQPSPQPDADCRYSPWGPCRAAASGANVNEPVLQPSPQPDAQASQLSPLQRQGLEPLLLEESPALDSQLSPVQRQGLEPALLEDQQPPSDSLPLITREDSDWSFLSNSVHTVESVELSEDVDTSSEEDRPQAPRWRRMRDYFWNPYPQSP